MSEQKTHAEIIAEMRNRAKRPDFVSQDVLKSCADELEAANKRERSDCAKLREAVKAVVDVGYPHNFQREAPHIRGYCYDITRAIEKCFAALAAPPRNCDCFKTAAEAIDAYQDLTGDQLATDSGMKEWVEFAVWLFAPATEKEGGAK